jgi:protein SCO1/2
MKSVSALIAILLFSLNSFSAELPDESIYHVGSNWQNQRSETIGIESLQGKIQVIAFVYTYCEHSCPVIMARLSYIERQLSEEQKNNIQFSLFSLDPARDTPKVFLEFFKKHNLDEKYWNMYNGDADSVLELAALLGVRYKPMDNENKDIAHSNMITVLDKQGRIQYQMKGLGENADDVVAQIIGATDAQQLED